MNNNNCCMSCFASITECYCRKNPAAFKKWVEAPMPLPVCTFGTYEVRKDNKVWLLFNSNILLEQVC